MKRGDLVWVPSDIMLLQLDESQKVATSFVTLKEPANGVLLEEGEVYYKVMVNGKAWEARKQDVYTVDMETNTL